MLYYTSPTVSTTKGLELVEFFDNAILAAQSRLIYRKLELVEFFDNAIFGFAAAWREKRLELVEFFDNAIFEAGNEIHKEKAGACRVF